MSEVKYRQPVFKKSGEFQEWHYWGVNIVQDVELANVGWLTFKLGITDPKDSMQFIGIKDKNGKDIYESDKIKYSVMIGGAGGWHKKTEEITIDSIFNYELMSNLKRAETIEIVENKFELISQ